MVVCVSFDTLTTIHTEFQNIQEKMTIESWHLSAIMAQQIKLKRQEIHFYSNWYNKGVRYVSDLLDEHGSF